MRLEYIAQNKLEKDLLAIFQKYLDLGKYKIFFFGSRVMKRGDERSDIDVGIEGESKLPSSTMAEIKEDVGNLPILYSIDVVDFKNVSKDFYEVAHQKIEPFNYD